MSAGSLNQHPQLQNVLNLCRRQIFLHTLIRGLATVVAVAIGCVLVATFFDYLFGLSSVIRSVSLGHLAGFGQALAAIDVAAAAGSGR
jgi:hypothetical protein